VGPLTRAPGFVADLRRLLAAWGLAERVRLAGPVPRPALQAAYRSADVLVHPSLAESYGMVVPEALAHGLPVLATAVGGVPEALGATSDGRRPGLLVPPGNVSALADALRRWLVDPAMRARLRIAAQERRDQLTDWSLTTGRVDQVLRQVAA
jgi:glycosyltransferase involved in cell wall biosynthesis